MSVDFHSDFVMILDIMQENMEYEHCSTPKLSSEIAYILNNQINQFSLDIEENAI